MGHKLAMAAAIALTAGMAWAGNTPDAAAIAKQGFGDQVPSCKSCHGADGGGSAAAGFPRLAGIGASYSTEQLNAMASGERKSPIMMPIAKALSKEQRRVLANYYSQLPVFRPRPGVRARRRGKTPATSAHASWPSTAAGPMASPPASSAMVRAGSAWASIFHRSRVSLPAISRISCAPGEPANARAGRWV
jgi:cytochrome c553